eukprot:3323575-Ditylum_brightwellii.AAC.1
MVVGTFLSYGRAVKPTILPSLNELEKQQSAPAEWIIKDIGMLLDYTHTPPKCKAVLLCRKHATQY